SLTGHYLTSSGNGASAKGFHKIAGQPFLIIRNCAGGIAKGFFLRREKWFEPIFIDRFHERFMWRNYAFFEQRPDGVVHKLHPLRLAGNGPALERLGRACAY